LLVILAHAREKGWQPSLRAWGRDRLGLFVIWLARRGRCNDAISSSPVGMNRGNMVESFSITRREAPVDFCYYSAFAIYSFFHLMESTNYQSLLGISTDSVSTAATALMLILLIPRLVVQRYSGKDLLRVSVVLLCGAAVFLVTRSWIVLSIGLFVCAGRKIRIDPLMYIMLINAVVVFIITYGGVRLGLIGSSLTSRMGETRVRDSLGFAQVNSVGFIGARICTATVVLRRRKTPWLSVITCLCIAAYIEVVANSRTSEVYLVALAIAALVLWVKGKSKEPDMDGVSNTCIALVVFSIIVSIAALLFFNPANSVLMELSELLSNRLYSMWYFSQNYSINLFGNSEAVYTMESIWTGNSYAMLTIDNAWALWLISYGLIPFVLIAIGIVSCLWSCRSSNYRVAYPVVAFALMCSLFAFCESSALAIDANPLMVLLACVVYGDPIETMIGDRK
jgi:hypothetical protein